MHEGRANNGQDCMIMHEPKASALSTIEIVIGLAQVQVLCLEHDPCVVVPNSHYFAMH